MTFLEREEEREEGLSKLLMVQSELNGHILDGTDGWRVRYGYE